MLSDAGSTPAASTTYLVLSTRLIDLPLPRLHNVSMTGVDSRGLEQPDRAVDRGRAQVHVPLRRAEVHVPGELLDRPRRGAAHRQVRTERVTQRMDADIAKIGQTSRSRNEQLNQVLGQWTAICGAEDSIPLQVAMPVKRCRQPKRQRWFR